MASDAETEEAGIYETLSQVLSLYSVQPNERSGAVGLTPISENILWQSRHPRIDQPSVKLRVMIVGNHSAGKSSFINWYVGEDVQKTGVAVETRHFARIANGKQRESLDGDASFRDDPRLAAALRGVDGLQGSFRTELCTSARRSFRSVDFFDTPGLSDAVATYPYDCDFAFRRLAQFVDVVFVFFDPVGQVTCNRTLDLLEKFNRDPQIAPKLTYVLTKIDTVTREADRYKLLVQVTQGLVSRLRLPPDFSLLTIALPASGEAAKDLDEICRQLTNGVRSLRDKALTKCERDIGELQSRIAVIEGQNRDAVQRNRRNVCLGLGCLLGCLFLLAALAMAFVMKTFPLQMLRLEDRPAIQRVVECLYGWKPYVKGAFGKIAVLAGGACAALIHIASVLLQRRPTLTSNERTRIVLFTEQLTLSRQRLTDLQSGKLRS